MLDAGSPLDEVLASSVRETRATYYEEVPA
jgi:hypothetical protein